MADYIDRKAFIEWLKTIPLKDLSNGLGLCRVIMEEDFQRCIKNIPQSTFIDSVPMVHGRWNELEPEIGLMECNLCGHKIMRATCNYCPNCGAKMDKDGDE